MLGCVSQKTVFQCLQSWVRYVDVPGDELARNPLLPAAFDALGKEELFETAVDFLIEVSPVFSRPIYHLVHDHSRHFLEECLAELALERPKGRMGGRAKC